MKQLIIAIVFIMSSCTPVADGPAKYAASPVLTAADRVQVFDIYGRCQFSGQRQQADRWLARAKPWQCIFLREDGRAVRRLSPVR